MEFFAVVKAGLDRILNPQAVVLMNPDDGMPVGGASSPMIAASGPVTTTTATIANGAAITGAIDIGSARLARLATPGAWTAANLTFQTSVDGVTFKNLYDIYGAEYTVVAAADRAILMPLADFVGVRYFKIRSGTSGTSVNQAADRILTLQLVTV